MNYPKFYVQQRSSDDTENAKFMLFKRIQKANISQGDLAQYLSKNQPWVSKELKKDPARTIARMLAYEPATLIKLTEILKWPINELLVDVGLIRPQEEQRGDTGGQSVLQLDFYKNVTAFTQYVTNQEIAPGEHPVKTVIGRNLLGYDSVGTSYYCVVKWFGSSKLYTDMDLVEVVPSNMILIVERWHEVIAAKGNDVVLRYNQPSNAIYLGWAGGFGETVYVSSLQKRSMAESDVKEMKSLGVVRGLFSNLEYQRVKKIAQVSSF